MSPQLTFNGSFDLAMYAIFGSGFRSGTFALPILFGGGVEYLMQPNVALTFQIKLGPTIFTAGGSGAVYAVRVGWHCIQVLESPRALNLKGG